MKKTLIQKEDSLELFLSDLGFGNKMFEDVFYKFVRPTYIPLRHNRIDDLARSYLGASDSDKFTLWFGEEAEDDMMAVQHPFVTHNNNIYTFNFSIFREQGEYFLIETRINQPNCEFSVKKYTVRELRYILEMT